MEDKVTPTPRNYRKLLFLIPVLLLALLLWKCTADNAEQRRVDEEIATAEGLAKIVSETFRDKSDLKVASVSGKVAVTSVNHGTIFTTKQRARYPYSVDYFVNLAELDGADLKYNPAAKELIVKLPDVTVASPNVDESRIEIIDRQGLFRSPRAGENLARRASSLAGQGAAKSAREPAKLQKARDNARATIGNLLQLPLKAAGHDDVKVTVRFPTEGTDDPSYINLSTPYDQAIREARERRAAEGKQ